MMRGYDHPLPQVEAMRIESLHAGVEMELRAAGGARAGHEPVEEQFAMSLRPIGRGGDEIVHVEDFSPGKKFRNAEAGDGLHAGIVHEGELEAAFALLAADALDELRLDEMRAQLGHDRETAEDLGIRFGELNVGHGARRMTKPRLLRKSRRGV